MLFWQIAGIHPENFRVLKTDSSTNYSLDPKVLSENISNDMSIGLQPFFLCATVRNILIAFLSLLENNPISPS